MKFRFLSLLAILILSSCNPYTKKMLALDKDFAAGKIEKQYYYPMKMQLLAQEQQYEADFTAAFLGSMNATSQNLVMQNQVNAYNMRTQALSRPTQVYHSGYINHNVNGTLYLR